MHYTLKSGEMTFERSGYCPVCCKKTVLLKVRSDPIYDVGVKDHEQGFIPAMVICCSLECAERYKEKLREVNSIFYSEKDVKALEELGCVGILSEGYLNSITAHHS